MLIYATDVIATGHVGVLRRKFVPISTFRRFAKLVPVTSIRGYKTIESSFELFEFLVFLLDENDSRLGIGLGSELGLGLLHFIELIYQLVLQISR